MHVNVYQYTGRRAQNQSRLPYKLNVKSAGHSDIKKNWNVFEL